ncbi:hypothetical protein YPPY32_3967 [Yersinia pestis PY-32]|nr:hypothetical protein YPPY05_3660 [Yersinia pestis PY-05]EIR03430.1 hypothetical protein YPPY06_3715 [Yersinia pestis PY-06]EIR62053.1 hypothetical protein YPPY25_3709 [Yersinia pestis PY-25]EIR71663.1 hypothetical protein YPPY29_3525 [Yersinia pestis PY-29]EIR73886.1 hypothetical protein YPPY32_3967 [Yersinia pestis PY-32]EIS14730.1 hypothetical protein YPPY52_3749 [Yersinia pestis PY-52]EIS27179.1 hypothetical protein YPPY55_3652 [Yersinia pestis PY-55]EIS29033.1 hypothetical protein YPP
MLFICYFSIVNIDIQYKYSPFIHADTKIKDLILIFPQ